MRLLSRIAYRAFVDIRARALDPKLVFALADALHNLPIVMYEPTFNWSWVLMFLEDLERAYPDVGSRYLAAFDEAIGFRDVM